MLDLGCGGGHVSYTAAPLAAEVVACDPSEEMLAAVAQPSQASQKLEAIAERLGVTVIGRHTALGDAMVTAEVFLKLIPLLQAQGIHTLGQASEAAQKTLYARLQY